MKTVLVLACFLIGLVSCKSTMDEDAVVPMEIPTNINSFQQYTFDELNLARTNPAQYAELRLKSDMENGEDNGSYLYFKNLAPLAALRFCNALNLSASDYSLFLADKNLMGHNENGTPLKRATIVGFEGSSIGENIAASSEDEYNSILNPQKSAIAFVRIMIIDNGVADLSHRLTILNPKYKSVGIGFNRNPASTFVNYTVQDFGNQ